MKALMTTTALVALLAAPALAQSATDTVATGPFYTPNADAQMAASFDLRASELIGKRLYTAETEMTDAEVMDVSDTWNDIGEINDILMARDGSTEAVLLDIGGFLGLGERTVAVTMDKLQFVRDGDNADDFFIVVQATADQLQNAPAFDLEGYDGWAWNASMTGDRVEAEVAEAADATEKALDAAGNEVAEAVDATGQAILTAEDKVAEAAETTEEAVEAEVAETEVVVEDADKTEMAATETAPADGTATTMSNRVEIAANEISTEQLIGARVYDSNDEWVGEVSELLIADSGEVEQVIMDIGGFLGLGEHSVAVSMNELKLMREGDATAISVHAGITGESMKDMPAWEGKDG